MAFISQFQQHCPAVNSHRITKCVRIHYQKKSPDKFTINLGLNLQRPENETDIFASSPLATGFCVMPW